MENDETDNNANESGVFTKYAKPLGAVIVTGMILYFLFGIPAYLLFRDI